MLPRGEYMKTNRLRLTLIFFRAIFTIPNYLASIKFGSWKLGVNIGITLYYLLDIWHSDFFLVHLKLLYCK